MCDVSDNWAKTKEIRFFSTLSTRSPPDSIPPSRFSPIIKLKKRLSSTTQNEVNLNSRPRIHRGSCAHDRTGRRDHLHSIGALYYFIVNIQLSFPPPPDDSTGDHTPSPLPMPAYLALHFHSSHLGPRPTDKIEQFPNHR